MSVYLPRSAVRPTISGRAWPSSTSALPNGASTLRPSTCSLSPMASVRPSAMPDRLEFAGQPVPFVGVDADEMRLLPSLERGHAFARQSAQHDRLRARVAAAGAVQCVDDLRHVVAVDLRGVPAEGAPFVDDRVHGHDDLPVGLDAVAVDQGDELV